MPLAGRGRKSMPVRRPRAVESSHESRCQPPGRPLVPSDTVALAVDFRVSAAGGPGSQAAILSGPWPRPAEPGRRTHPQWRRPRYFKSSPRLPLAVGKPGCAAAAAHRDWQLSSEVA